MSDGSTEKLFFCLWNKLAFKSLLSLTDMFDDKPVLLFTLEKTQQLCLITAVTQDPFRTPNRSEAVLYTQPLKHCRVLPGCHWDFRVSSWYLHHLQVWSSALYVWLYYTSKQTALSFLSQLHFRLSLQVETFRVFFWNNYFYSQWNKKANSNSSCNEKKKTQINLEISRLACWQGSTDPSSGFLMFGSILILPPRVNSSFFLYVDETLLEALMCNAKLGGAGFCVLLARARVHYPASQLFSMTSPHRSHLREQTLLETKLLLLWNIYLDR